MRILQKNPGQKNLSKGLILVLTGGAPLFKKMPTSVIIKKVE